ncbi:MAG: hypothetical protein ACK5PP_16375 [Acidimicrobiales bacterium]
MEVLIDNWPAILIGLAIALVVVGLIQRLLKLALLGAVIGVAGLVLWPMVAGG